MTYGKSLWAVLFFLLFTAMASRTPADGKAKDAKAPAFPSQAVWLNRDRVPAKAFSQRVTLVYFWDYTSANCLRELGLLKRWHARYRAYGFEIILVHTPEFEFAKARENVERAIQRLEIPFPVLLDNDAKLWEMYKNASWPAKYLVDRAGLIVYSRTGEGKDFELENFIRKELNALDPKAVLPPPELAAEFNKFDAEQCGRVSSDVYVGYKRVNWWSGDNSNLSKALPNETFLYQDGETHGQQGFFVQGLWKNQADRLELARTTKELSDYVGVYFVGYEAYAVVNQHNGARTARVYVTRDGVPVPAPLRGADLHEDENGLTYFLLEEPRLYYLIKGENGKPHQLKIWPDQEGVAIHSFSFANRCMADYDHL